jgi:hypothetical protein
MFSLEVLSVLRFRRMIAVFWDVTSCSLVDNNQHSFLNFFKYG